MVGAGIAPFVFRCSCGAPGDFEAESREVETVRVRFEGVERTIEQYRRFYLCEECARLVVLGSDQPRHLEALPHHAARKSHERSEANKKRRAVLADEQGTFGADWGRPPK